jgi:hypothetical protein
MESIILEVMGIQYREPTPSTKGIGGEDAGINTFHIEIKYKRWSL